MSDLYFQLRVMYHFFVLTPFWWYLWSITVQEKKKEEGNVHLPSQLLRQQKKTNQLQKFLMSFLLIWVSLSGKKSALGLKCFPRPKAGGSNQGLRSNFFPIQTYLNYHFKDAMTIIQQFPPHQHTHHLLSLNFCDRVWWDGTWWRVALMRNISVKQRYPGSVSTASLHICHLLFFCILVWCGVAWVSSSLNQE